MRVVIVGAAGFIGTNLAIELVKRGRDEVTVVDENADYFFHYPTEVMGRVHVHMMELPFHENTDFNNCLEGQEYVYHLISTNNLTTSNKKRFIG